jgi:hypothetical protein
MVARVEPLVTVEADLARRPATVAAVAPRAAVVEADIPTAEVVVTPAAEAVATPAVEAVAIPAEAVTPADIADSGGRDKQRLRNQVAVNQ